MRVPSGMDHLLAMSRRRDRTVTDVVGQAGVDSGRPKGYASAFCCTDKRIASGVNYCCRKIVKSCCTAYRQVTLSRLMRHVDNDSLQHDGVFCSRVHEQSVLYRDSFRKQKTRQKNDQYCQLDHDCTDACHTLRYMGCPMLTKPAQRRACAQKRMVGPRHPSVKKQTHSPCDAEKIIGSCP